MKQLKYRALLALLLLTSLGATAQQLFTADFAPYELRADAEGRVRNQKNYYRDFAPKPISSTDSTITSREIFVLPDNWSDRVLILHIEQSGAAYDVAINNQKIFAQEDALTPTNIDITRYIIQGVNRIDVTMRGSQSPKIDDGVVRPTLGSFKGSYIVAQPHTYIHDFNISIGYDPDRTRGVLYVEAILRNNFSKAESVEVGYDIYDPAGKLVDYSVNPFEVKGGATDTVRFSPTVIGALNNKWSTDSPRLYRVMLYTRRRGVAAEYIPLKVGFLDVTYTDNKLYNFGKQITVKSKPYTAASTPAQTRKELAAIKRAGANTITPSYPQPMWVYEMCNELGLWVIEQVNINATATPNDKRVGGTPSNDPALLSEYIGRAKAAHARSHNMGCIVGYSLGSESSGNGYNMYKLYEWMKGLNLSRPVIYNGAGGEWNSDIIE